MWLFRNSEFVKQIGLSAAGTLLAGLSAGILWGREAFAAALLSSLFWCIAHLRREIRRFQGMRLLAGQIDELLHGSDIPEFKHFHEGDLEILRDEIYKMTIRLKEQAALLQKEKSSLADALADISHQIRTPLTALNILLERLKARNSIYMPEGIFCGRPERFWPESNGWSRLSLRCPSWRPEALPCKKRRFLCQHFWQTHSRPSPLPWTFTVRPVPSEAQKGSHLQETTPGPWKRCETSLRTGWNIRRTAAG